MIAGVRDRLASYLCAEAARVIDAWGLAGADRARVDDEVARAAAAATERVTGALTELFALDPAEQRATPLEVVRSAVREPTDVLRAAGIPPVMRDELDERHLPHDVYDLTPRAIGDLGDPELGPELLAWGLAKARVLRARAQVAGERDRGAPEA